VSLDFIVVRERLQLALEEQHVPRRLHQGKAGIAGGEERQRAQQQDASQRQRR
jgi:hypothetical protein